MDILKGEREKVFPGVTNIRMEGTERGRSENKILKMFTVQSQCTIPSFLGICLREGYLEYFYFVF